MFFSNFHFMRNFKYFLLFSDALLESDAKMYKFYRYKYCIWISKEPSRAKNQNVENRLRVHSFRNFTNFVANRIFFCCSFV